MPEPAAQHLPQQFSQRHQDSIAVMAIVEAIARADGWDSLDECFAENAGIIETYMRFADAALNAIKRLHGEEMRH